MAHLNFFGKSPLLSLSLTIALSAAGCGSIAPETGLEGGKAEGFVELGHCMEPISMISTARVELILEDSVNYSDDSFKDETAFVESLGDLNGDGVNDALVFPGMSYAGANTEQVVYLSNADGCATLNVGHFSESSIIPAEDGAVHNGVRDLTSVNTSGCERTTSRYTFDGKHYVDGGSTEQNLCESQACISDETLIVTARVELILEDSVNYSDDSFKDETAFVESLGDLNGDGVDDALVFPGMNHSGANTEQVVYLSDADGCTTLNVGHFNASSITPTEDGAVNKGVRDLIGVNTSGCESTIHHYVFDGERYVIYGTTVENLCGN